MRDAQAKILQIGNFPPPMCGWSIHTELLHRALRARGVASRVLDIGPSRQIVGRDCEPTFGALDYLWKLFHYRRLGYTFHAHVNGDSWKGYVLALMAVLIGRMSGRPALLTFHAGPVQQRFPRQQGFWFRAFQLLFRSSGQIICNHEPVRALIMAYGVPAERVHAIPAFSIQYGEGPQAVLPSHLERFAETHSPLVFSYTLFRPEFTVELLIEAVRELRSDFPALGLLIVGPKETPPEVTAALTAAGIGPHVVVAGNLPHDEFLAAMRRADVVVRTHLRDGVCSSVLEALMLGIPVVASEDGIRPPSVVTYQPGVRRELTRKLAGVLANLEEARANVVRPVGQDHLAREVELVLDTAR